MEFSKNVVGYILAMAFVEGLLKPAVVYATQRSVKHLVKLFLNRVDTMLVDPSLRKEWKESPYSFVKDRVVGNLPVPMKSSVIFGIVDSFLIETFERKTGVKYYG